MDQRLAAAQELDRMYAEAAAFDADQQAKWLAAHPCICGNGDCSIIGCDPECVPCAEAYGEDEMELLQRAGLNRGQP